MEALKTANVLIASSLEALIEGGFGSMKGIGFFAEKSTTWRFATALSWTSFSPVILDLIGTVNNP